MKVSIVTKATDGWYVDQLKEQAAVEGVNLELTNIESLNSIKETVDNLGEVVIWRAADIDITVSRSALLGVLKDKNLINHALQKHPYVTHKLFQQKTVEKLTTLNYIPTYNFKTRTQLLEAVEQGLLKFPFIQKPNLGSKGNDVSLIKSVEEIEALDIKFKDYIYQNFIKNSGDYRVLVLGGRVIGAIKRVAQEDSFLNNVSKGGSAYAVTDEKILAEISDIATTIASLFDLTMCGVDVMYDTENEKYFFLEVNTAPQWQGFQTATGINVANEIMKLCKAFLDRRVKPTATCVEEYYNNSFPYLEGKKFHFASRMYLWTRDELNRKRLDDLRSYYLGNSDDELRTMIVEMVNPIRSGNEEKTKTLSKKLREEHFAKFPNLTRFNKVLFHVLFAETVYGKDIRPMVSELISETDLLQLRDALLQDKAAIATLSTHAVNYFYLLENYHSPNGERDYIDPEYLYQIAMEQDTEGDAARIRFQIYLLTHCIIGASRFYSRKIEKDLDWYQKMVKSLEVIIQDNYFAVSLDNKLEFLVCAELCRYESQLKSLIFGEADRSLALTGNFLIDKLNDKESRLSNKVAMSEHRNVLYIMANKPFALN